MDRTWTYCVAALGLMLGTGSGCAALDQLMAERGADTGEMGSVESSLLATATERSIEPATAEEAAADAAEQAPEQFGNGCVEATANGETVVYELTDCTGRYGLVTITGTVTVFYSQTEDGLSALASSDNLDVNGGSYVLDAEGLLFDTGTGRALEVVTASSGVSARGNEIARSGAYVVTVDEGRSCVGLNGEWETIVDGDRGWDTAVTDYERCIDSCPTAGGDILLTGRLHGATLSIDFDGSNSAAWESSRGNSGTVDLRCP